VEYPEGPRHGGVAACSCVLVKILNSSGDMCVKACCHKSRIGLSVGTLVSRCSKLLIQVSVGCFGESGRPNMVEFVTPLALEG
jgi:hypothetical protein